MASDSFVGSASTAIDTHDANWVQTEGNGTPQLDGTGGLMEPIDTRQSAWIYSGASNDSSWALLPAPTTVSGNSSCMLGAVSIRGAGADYGYRIFVNSALNELIINKSGTGLISIQSLSPTINTSSEVIVGAEFGSFAGGTNIRFTVKQGATTQQFLHNDGTPKSAGSPGIFIIAGDSVGGLTAILEWNTSELSFAAAANPGQPWQQKGAMGAMVSM